jgi:hypothetical protein
MNKEIAGNVRTHQSIYFINGSIPAIWFKSNHGKAKVGLAGVQIKKTIEDPWVQNTVKQYKLLKGFLAKRE